MWEIYLGLRTLHNWISFHLSRHKAVCPCYIFLSILKFPARYRTCNLKNIVYIRWSGQRIYKTRRYRYTWKYHSKKLRIYFANKTTQQINNKSHGTIVTTVREKERDKKTSFRGTMHVQCSPIVENDLEMNGNRYFDFRRSTFVTRVNFENSSENIDASDRSMYTDRCVFARYSSSIVYSFTQTDNANDTYIGHIYLRIFVIIFPTHTYIYFNTQRNICLDLINFIASKLIWWMKWPTTNVSFNKYVCLTSYKKIQIFVLNNFYAPSDIFFFCFNNFIALILLEVVKKKY